MIITYLRKRLVCFFLFSSFFFCCDTLRLAFHLFHTFSVPSPSILSLFFLLYIFLYFLYFIRFCFFYISFILSPSIFFPALPPSIVFVFSVSISLSFFAYIFIFCSFYIFPVSSPSTYFFVPLLNATPRPSPSIFVYLPCSDVSTFRRRVSGQELTRNSTAEDSSHVFFVEWQIDFFFLFARVYFSHSSVYIREFAAVWVRESMYL